MEDPSQQSANAGAMLSQLKQTQQNSGVAESEGGGEGGRITGASGYSASSMFSEATSALFGSLPDDGYIYKMFADVASFASSALETITGLAGDLGNLGVLGAALKDAVFRGMSDDKSVAGIGVDGGGNPQDADGGDSVGGNPQDDSAFSQSSVGSSDIEFKDNVSMMDMGRFSPDPTPGGNMGAISIGAPDA